MSSSGDSTTKAIETNIERILQKGGTPQCSIWAELPDGQQFHRTIHSRPLDNPESNDYERNDTVLYEIGSLTKIFVAYALVILVERLAKSDEPRYERFRDLQEAWNKGVRKYINVTLPGDPTIDNLLSYFKGLPSMNDFLFGPDGTVLITKDEFPDVAEYISREDYNYSKNKQIWRYGNGGYILAGIIIETYSNTPLAQFLEDNIFRPFDMTSTCVNLESFNSLPQEAVAQPHIISTDLSAQLIECPRYFETPAFAAMGIYSCTRDLAIFFRGLLTTLANEPALPDQNAQIVKRFLHPYVEFKENRGMYSFCGHHTNLCTTQPGNGSLNRLVTTPDSTASVYSLGTDHNGLPLKVIYGSGMVTGYECCFYFMPEMKSFVIVLSNATGLVDASDHISRLLLQELFDLKYQPSKLKPFIDKVKPSKGKLVDFIEKAELGARERRKYIEKFLSQNLSPVTSVTSADFVGRYTNSKCHQQVIISYTSDGVLEAQISGTAGNSRPFRIILVDKTTLRLCKDPLEKSPFLSIDVFADWKSLDLVIGKDNSGNVVSLTRARENFSVVYTRTSNSRVS